MKTLRTLAGWIAFLALGIMLFFTSCSKDEIQDQQQAQPSYTVRPDFATLDTRPAEVIAQYQLTEKDASPVPLRSLKAGGKFALVIGISDYKDEANDLQYCDDDANDWKARLQSEGYTVTTLLDRNATKTAIEAAVNTLASQSIAGNEIAFCYSGHGSRGNIISTDLYYISSTWFKTKFAGATSTKMMFCFDACQIGAMATDLKATGRVVAVASSKTSYSYDGDATMKNGVYTYYQMKGFDSQGIIELEPDCDYANAQFLAWAKTAHVKVAPSYTDLYTVLFDL